MTGNGYSWEWVKEANARYRGESKMKTEIEICSAKCDHLICLQHKVHAQALKSGFWRTCDDPECVGDCCPDVRVDNLSKPCINSSECNKPANIPEKIALMHSELSEALEEYRKKMAPASIYYIDERSALRIPYPNWQIPQGAKPEGLPIELADCIIRILDFCAAYDIDLMAAMHLKIEYNATRPFKHGKVC